MRPTAAAGPAAAVLCLTLLGVAPVLLSQPPDATTPTPDAASSVVSDGPGVGMHVGPHTCGSTVCHGSTVPREVYPIRQNEYLLWSTLDPHVRAWEVLLDERSLVIGRNLGLSAPPSASRRCTTCHVLSPPPGTVAPGTRLAVEDGISCEACHGPAGGWLGSHDEEGFSAATADATAAGMTDLGDPAARAGVCLSCHLGEGPRGGGKSVDHLLLAAGHPQLTFELDNYGADVSHWREPSPGESVALWAVGQAAALEAELARLAAHAEAGAWPELSALRCRDCHHGLEEERWRSGDRRVTGQPRWSPARWAVLRPLLSRLAGDAATATDRSLDALADAVGDLGTPAAEVARAARSAQGDAATARRALEGRQWSPRTLAALLAALAAEGPRLADADYESAQQVAFAVSTLASALVAADPSLLTTPLPDAEAALYAVTTDPYRFDRDRFVAALARLEEAVRRLEMPR
jgi:hypothetical protein